MGARTRLAFPCKQIIVSEDHEAHMADSPSLDHLDDQRGLVDAAIVHDDD